MTKKERETFKKLVHPNPSAEAQALISYLADCYGTCIISGQHEAEQPHLGMDLCHQ